MSLPQIFTIINLIFGALFVICYAHQIFYVFYTLFKKPKTYPPTHQTNRYAVLICGRNEEEVIGYLLDSIQTQDYPRELVDVYVCADNCTDKTADVARDHGATVLERFNTEWVGKGYALSDLIQMIYDAHGTDHYEGFFVVDADNLLDTRFITEMDQCFCSGEGYGVIAGYRNSKNFDENWLSSGYSVWFLHEGKQLNNARSLLGVSGAVSGTGFMIHKDVLKNQGGWIHHLLIEDVEFSADNLIKGVKIGYCHDAILYDEQPVSFRQSWFQRLRWVKGYLQVLRRYGGGIFKGIFRKGGFSCYDLLTNIGAAYLVVPAAFMVNVVYLILCLLFDPAAFPWALATGLVSFFMGYLAMFFLSFFACITEKSRIHASTAKRIKAMLVFPFFMMSFVPIAMVAVFTRKVKWRPIRHRVKASVEDIRKDS